MKVRVGVSRGSKPFGRVAIETARERAIRAALDDLAGRQRRQAGPTGDQGSADQPSPKPPDAGRS